jgi:hypothetical protein
MRDGLVLDFLNTVANSLGRIPVGFDPDGAPLLWWDGHLRLSQNRKLKYNRGTPACLDEKSPLPPPFFCQKGVIAAVPPFCKGGQGGIFLRLWQTFVLRLDPFAEF